MDFVKKIINSKYFLVLTFFFLVLVFSILLYATIQQDISSGQPSDGYNRAQAEIADNPDGIISIDSVDYYEAPIYVNVKISENETIQYIPIRGPLIKVSDIPDMKVGTKITVKYPDENHSEIYYTNDPDATYRTFLYIVYIIIILGSIVGFFLFIRRNRIRDHRLVMEENIRKMKEEKEKSEEGSFNSLDRTVSADDIFNPFSDSGIDYNAKYEQDKFISDATFNENDAFATFDNDPLYPEEQSSPQQSSQPAPSYASFGAAVPDSQPAEPYSNFGSAGPYGNQPYETSSEQKPEDIPQNSDQSYSGYGAPNPSMDAPYDPTAPYTGYGAPNPSMDTQYDPFAPYTGY